MSWGAHGEKGGFYRADDGDAGIGRENFSECGNFEQWAADASSRESAKVVP